MLKQISGISGNSQLLCQLRTVNSPISSQAVSPNGKVTSISRITVFVNGHIWPFWEATKPCGLVGSSGRGRYTLDSILHKCHAKILAEMQFGHEDGCGRGDKLQEAGSVVRLTANAPLNARLGTRSAKSTKAALRTLDNWGRYQPQG